MQYRVITKYSDKLKYFTVCGHQGRGCGWKESVRHASLSECFVSVCPSCGSDNVSDESELE